MDGRDPHTRRTVLFSAGALLLVAAFFLLQIMNGPKNISPREAEVLLRTDTTVVALDVRTVGEFLGPTGHLRRAVHIPVDELEERLEELERFSGRTIVVYCRSGHRSRNASSFLEGRGFRALNLTGGIVEWNALSLPVASGNRTE